MNNNIKARLKEQFPVYKLSYGRILHKKVSADLYYLIPRGKKQFIWFTCFDNRSVCLLINYKKNYDSSVEIIDLLPHECCFDKELSYGKGTIFNGILITINNYKTLFHNCLYFLYFWRSFFERQL